VKLKSLAELLPAAVTRSGAAGSPEYYNNLVANGFGPGWARPERSLWPVPESKFLPAVWRYSDAKTALNLAGQYVPMHLTERRNLLMINPRAGNLYPTVSNLVAAYQMIQPGETADDHRHTPHALRVVIDCSAGVYTVVNGERVDMTPDDLVFTPGGFWHGHANESEQCAYWIDVLDVPLVHHLESMFFEQNPQGFRRPERLAIDSTLRIPLSRAATAAVTPGVATATLPSHLPTMSLELLKLDSGAHTVLSRCSANMLLIVLSGTCDVQVEGEISAPGCLRGDLVAIPLWKWHSIAAREPTCVLCISDQPIYEQLGYFRTETRNSEP